MEPYSIGGNLKSVYRYTHRDSQTDRQIKHFLFQNSQAALGGINIFTADSSRVTLCLRERKTLWMVELFKPIHLAQVNLLVDEWINGRDKKEGIKCQI